MGKQVEAIRAAIGPTPVPAINVEVRAALCFVGADWSLFAKPFILDGVWIGWKKALSKQLTVEGELAPEQLQALARRVAGALPPA